MGFVVLVAGTSLYNELIRSCLPTMYESTVDSDLEVSRLGDTSTVHLHTQWGAQSACQLIAGLLCDSIAADAPTSFRTSGCPAGHCLGNRMINANEPSCPLDSILTAYEHMMAGCSRSGVSLQDALLPAAPEDSRPGSRAPRPGWPSWQCAAQPGQGRQHQGDGEAALHQRQPLHHGPQHAPFPHRAVPAQVTSILQPHTTV